MEITLTEFCTIVGRSKGAISNWLTRHSDLKERYCRIAADRQMYVDRDLIPHYTARKSVTKPSTPRQTEDVSKIETSMPDHSLAQSKLADYSISQSEFDSDPIIIMRKAQLEHSKRLAAVESDIQDFKLAKLQAAEQLSLLPAPQVEARKMTDRALIRQAINTYAQAKGAAHQDVWAKFYKEIYYRMGINCTAQAKHKGCLAIDILEQEGVMTEAYAIAAEILKI